MQRPTSATVFGILNILFAVIGVFSILATITLFSATAQSANPVAEIVRENAAYAAWMKVSLLLGIATCLVLLAAGIGLLMVREWARKLSVGYAIYALVFGTIGTAINFVFLFRPLFERAAQGGGPEAAGAIGGAIGGVIGGCFGMVYPIVLLIFMLRKNVVAAFRSPPVPPSLPPVSPA
jgi:hypothetical protein